ncbi:hypothetical protein [Sporosarcina psychrophila]|uniref:hypothetical protein n=1 Tax=Sporosarcina psychrophila TaxID=1476 RepID=UPI000A48239C|nr:hypothetical protein [Sporosarcina psychrophila]
MKPVFGNSKSTLKIYHLQTMLSGKSMNYLQQIIISATSSQKEQKFMKNMKSI